jgi:hypothetical protein
LVEVRQRVRTFVHDSPGGRHWRADGGLDFPEYRRGDGATGTRLAYGAAVPIARLFALLVVSVLFSAQASGGPVEVPFVFHNGLIWVRLDQPAPGPPLHFLLDSGAGATVLDVQAARRLGLKFGGREAVQGVDGRCAAYRVDGFRAAVAGIPLAHALLALDLGPVSRSCGERIDGLIGADFFRGRIVQVDYAAERIRIFAPGEFAPGADAQVLPLAIRNDAFCVQASVNGCAPQWLRLDTGCDSALEWVPGPHGLQNGAGASIAATTGRPHALAADLRLGPERLHGVKAGLHAAPMFAGESGLLGNGVLSQFRITFDASGPRAFLARVR